MGFDWAPRLRQREAKFVMRLGQIRIGHHRLAELFDRVRAIVPAPIEQSQARMSLRVIRFQLERFLIGCKSTLPIVFALPRYSQIVVARWKLRTLLHGFLEERQRFVELLLLQRLHALSD